MLCPMHSLLKCLLLALIAASVLPLAALAAPIEPPAAPARFSLVVDGVELGTFSDVQGITTEVEPVDVAVLLKKLPGKLNPPTVTLRRGLSSSLALLRWQSLPIGGVTERKSASLVMSNAEGKPVARYHLENAWPVKVVAEFDATKNELSIQSMELVPDRIQVVP